MTKRSIHNLLICFILLILVGCASKTKGIRTVEGDPAVLYKEGLALFNKRNYPDAQKKFEDIKSGFPDSPPYSLWAEVKIADCLFHKKKYVEAVVAYEEFRKLHPTYEEIPYVQYQIGMSYYNQMLTLDRDQTSTGKALSSFEYLVANYPQSFFTEKAKEKIGFCRDRLAGHEFYIANYYYKKKNYWGAAHRFEGLLDQFPKMPDEDRTLYLLGECYVELGQRENAREVFSLIVTEYPGSRYYREVKTILDQGTQVRQAATAQAMVPGSTQASSETEGPGQELVFVKFEEEGRKPVSLREPRPSEEEEGQKKPEGTAAEEEKLKFSAAAPEAAQPTVSAPPKQEVRAEKEEQPQTAPQDLEEEQKVDREEQKPEGMRTGQKKLEFSGAPPELAQSTESAPSTQEVGAEEKEQPQAASQDLKEQKEVDREEPAPPWTPETGDRTAVSPEAGPRIDMKPEEEVRMAALPRSLPPAEVEKERAGDKAPAPKIPVEFEKLKVGELGEPIDITSDTVETFSKENLIAFKGNVIARQKDVVIYADSLEAVLSQDGKGIDRVIAGGNVKIQQGLRVASCQKAVFYNLERKVVLTGDPKVLDGENMVSGEEILFDVERNRVEVKGGSVERGKAKIQP